MTALPEAVPVLAPADAAAVEVAVAAFRGIQRGAATGIWDDFVDLLAEDVRIMIPVPASEENAPEGVLRGKDVARQMFTNRHVEKVQGAVLEGKRITANGSVVSIESRVEGNLGGEVVANHFVFVFEVAAGGEIASMYEYATWTAKGPHSGWGDPAFARDAFAGTVLPYGG
ncbi:nuclear transport factor 2 family protein [Pseudonocardia sp. CA-107938]|uniref:nuclear transport factor 2 family protein n=1 Tax=Pseudonocardia sp. CA-107938 TaxID=3240021 RepID=UPI003D95022E